MKLLRNAAARGGCAGRRRNNYQLLSTKEGQITGPKCQGEGYQSLSVRGRALWLRYKRSEAIPGWVSCRRQQGAAVSSTAQQQSSHNNHPRSHLCDHLPFRPLPFLLFLLSAFLLSIVLRSLLRTASFFCAELSANCLLLPLSDTLCPLPSLILLSAHTAQHLVHRIDTVCALPSLPRCHQSTHHKGL